MELEKCHGRQVSLEVKTTLGKGDYERWSFDGWNKMITVILLSPPDQFGYFEDTIFQVASVAYLGLPHALLWQRWSDASLERKESGWTNMDPIWQQRCYQANGTT